MGFKSVSRTVLIIGMVGIGLAGFNVASAAVILNAGNAGCSGYLSTPSEPNVVTAFKLACATGDVSELYKSDFVKGAAIGTDSGPFKNSYVTTFGVFKEAGLEDPTTADIVYQIAQLVIAGYDKIFVLAKDGRHDPSYYGWNISSWNGTDTISITAWDSIEGSISHVSIWGEKGTTTVAEPGSMVLLGLGIFGAGLVRRRARRA